MQSPVCPDRLRAALIVHKFWKSILFFGGRGLVKGGVMLYQCAYSTRLQKKSQMFKEAENCFILALLT